MATRSKENLTITWNKTYVSAFQTTTATGSHISTDDVNKNSSYMGDTTMFLNASYDNTTSKYHVQSNLGTCKDWQEAQHALFQLANLCLVVAFLTPSSFKHHAFFLRCILNFGFLFFSLWAGLFVCMPDMLSWNLAFCFINTVHICYLGYRMFPPRIGAELDAVYIKLFKPLQISRKMFKELKTIGDLYILTKGNTYAREGKSKCGEKVSILLKGRLKVTHDQLFLHFIEANHFIDSPEYDARCNGDLDRYQVTIIAVEDCLLLTWPYQHLQAYLESNPFVSSVFHLLIGKDISDKLYQIQELLMNNPNYMQSLPSRQSSMVNLRSTIVTQSSSDLAKLKCFGLDITGWLTDGDHLTTCLNLVPAESCSTQRKHLKAKFELPYHAYQILP